MTALDMAKLPLVRNPTLKADASDPQTWASTMQRVIPVNICEPRSLHQEFWNTSASLAIGNVLLIASEGSAITAITGDHRRSQQSAAGAPLSRQWNLDH